MSSNRSKRRHIQKTFVSLLSEVERLDTEEIAISTESNSEQNPSDFENIPVTFPNYESDSASEVSNSSSQGCELEFETKSELNPDLANWAVKHNITATAVDDLLQLVLKNFPNSGVPKTSKTLLQTPTVYKIENIDGGNYYHFGLVAKLLYFSSLPYFVDDFETVYLNIGIDGLPISRSSKK